MDWQQSIGSKGLEGSSSLGLFLVIFTIGIEGGQCPPYDWIKFVALPTKLDGIFEFGIAST
jgi:hypothetical protein